MRKITFKNAILIILIVSLLSIGLTSCVDIVVPGNTGTVKLVVSGNNEYYLYMDDHPIIVDNSYAVPEGTYILYNVSAGDHDFEAVDTRGQNFGYDSKTKFISAGTTTTVYLNPTSKTATVYIVVSGTGTGRYDIKIDGITKFSNKPSGTYKLSNVSIDSHFFEAVDTWGASFGYDSITKFIYPGDNYVYLYPSSPIPL